MCLAPLGQTDSTEPVVVASLGVVRGASVKSGGRRCFFQPMGAARKGVPPLSVGGESFGTATAWPVGYTFLSLLQYRIGPVNTCYLVCWNSLLGDKNIRFTFWGMLRYFL